MNRPGFIGDRFAGDLPRRLTLPDAELRLFILGSENEGDGWARASLAYSARIALTGSILMVRLSIFWTLIQERSTTSLSLPGISLPPTFPLAILSSTSLLIILIAGGR